MSRGVSDRCNDAGTSVFRVFSGTRERERECVFAVEGSGVGAALRVGDGEEFGQRRRRMSIEIDISRRTVRERLLSVSFVNGEDGQS